MAPEPQISLKTMASIEEITKLLSSARQLAKAKSVKVFEAYAAAEPVRTEWINLEIKARKLLKEWWELEEIVLKKKEQLEQAKEALSEDDDGSGLTKKKKKSKKSKKKKKKKKTKKSKKSDDDVEQSTETLEKSSDEDDVEQSTETLEKSGDEVDKLSLKWTKRCPKGENYFHYFGEGAIAVAIRIMLNSEGKASIGSTGEQTRYILVSTEDYEAGSVEKYTDFAWIKENIASLSNGNGLQFAKLPENYMEPPGEVFAIKGDFQSCVDFGENKCGRGRRPRGKIWMKELNAWVHDGVEQQSPAPKKLKKSKQ